jgi:succinate dehydrogenase/fumarate reductase flavoprotein subunit
MCTENEATNLNLVRKINTMELELQKLQADNKRMQKKHREEMRIRDKKEIATMLVVAGCVLMYACVALLTRGFV